jgi:DNA invertase Pin-like site-specific DNA recombinase
MKVAIYARVSTQHQENDMQLTPLREYVQRMGWEATEYLEKESSMKKRPVFDRMIEDARQRKIDTILVWKIDRFARSMKQFVNVTCELASHGVSVRSLTQNISSDASDPMGKFLLGLFGLLAELERNIIVERVKAGVAEAQRQGKHCGRPMKVFARGKAEKLRKQGMSWRAIAAKLGVSVSTIRDALGVGGNRRLRGVRKASAA